jgi:hypothetical protein
MALRILEGLGLNGAMRHSFVTFTYKIAQKRRVNVIFGLLRPSGWALVIINA